MRSANLTVVGVLLAAGVGLLGVALDASAAKHGAPPVKQNPIKPRKGTWYVLQRNSMRVDADATEGTLEVLSAFEYECPDAPDQRYQIVRTVTRAPVELSPCDEVFGAIVQEQPGTTFEAVTVTDRWTRMDGGGSPLGFFEGELAISADVPGAVNATGPEFFFKAKLHGTIGLRPGPDTDRCEAPLHEEGAYEGRFIRNGMKRMLRNCDDMDPDEKASFRRRVGTCRLAGTFEGELVIGDGGEGPLDYVALLASRHWFDGVQRAKCDPQGTPPEREPPQYQHGQPK